MIKLKLLNGENVECVIPYYKKGNKIHIKKSRVGSFTSYCGGKVTQECITKAKNSPNPAIRKKAVFADNSRKYFNH